MSDLIDRQAAIDAIRASTSKYTGFMEMEMYTDDDAVEAIEALPSAQPERKKGKWIDETFEPWGLVYHPYKCDQCGEHSEADSNFCPHCGADMRGEQDG